MSLEVSLSSGASVGPEAEVVSAESTSRFPVAFSGDDPEGLRGEAVDAPVGSGLFVAQLDGESPVVGPRDANRLVGVFTGEFEGGSVAGVSRERAVAFGAI